MTESLKAKIRAAKTDEEVMEAFINGKDDFTQEDFKLIAKELQSSGELSADDLDAIVGGSILKDELKAEFDLEHAKLTKRPYNKVLYPYPPVFPRIIRKLSELGITD